MIVHAIHKNKALPHFRCLFSATVQALTLLLQRVKTGLPVKKIPRL